MAIDFSRLFTTLGKLIGGLNEVNDYRGGTLADRVDDINADLNDTFPSTLSNLFLNRDSAVTSSNSWVTSLQSLAQSVLIEEVVADRPVARSLSSAWAELVRQMKAGTVTLPAVPSSTSVSAAGSNVGDPSVAVTTKDGSGVVSDLLLPDVYLLQVTADKDRGGTRWAEGIRIKGKPADTSPTDHTYCSGSGVDTQTSLYDPASTLNNLAADPGFSDWTGNTPTSWSIVTGTAGTNVLQVSDDPRGGTGTAASLVSTGALVKIRQLIDVDPNTVYSAHFKWKPTTSTGSHCRVTMLLVDAAGSVISDDASNANQLTSASSSGLSGWQQVTGFFITPKVPPTAVYLEIRLNSAAGVGSAADATNAASVDHAHVGAARQLHTAGPFYAAYSGLTSSVTDDSHTLTVTYPSSGDLDSYLVVGLDRLLGIRNLSPRVPTVSSGSTISDSVVT